MRSIETTTFNSGNVQGSDPSAAVSSVELVYQRTRQGILDGTLGPGEALRNQEMADRHGVSMIPVREALRMLEAEGFVELIPNRGARVAPLSQDDMDDLYGIRIVLEVEAMRQAFPRITADICKEARQLIHDLYALGELDSPQAQTIHRQFHFLFYDQSASRWLLRMIDSVWDHSERFRIQMATGVDPESSREQHLRILAAVESGDQNATLEALRKHLEHSRDWLTTMYSSSEFAEASNGEHDS